MQNRELPHREARVIRVLIFEGLANLAVFAVKVFVGWRSGSTAILGESLHSLTDLLNNGVAITAVRVSANPPDSDHPYGHRKFEQLAVFVLATLLSVAGIQIALHAFTNSRQPIESTTSQLFLMGGVLLVNLIVAGWENAMARRLDSDVLRADAGHTWSDVLTTTAVIGGWQLAAQGFRWVDSVLAVVVAGLVFALAFGLFRRAVPVLVDRVAADPDDVILAVGSLPDVREVRRIRSRRSGSGVAADVVIAVDGALSTERSHEIASAVEEALASRLGIDDVTVHIEPVNKYGDKQHGASEEISS